MESLLHREFQGNRMENTKEYFRGPADFPGMVARAMVTLLPKQMELQFQDRRKSDTRCGLEDDPAFKRRKFELELARDELSLKKEQAQFDADARVASAKADADIIIIIAKAEAEARRIRGSAEQANVHTTQPLTLASLTPMQLMSHKKNVRKLSKTIAKEVSPLDESFIAECLHLCKRHKGNVIIQDLSMRLFGRCPTSASMIGFLHAFYTKTTFNYVNLRPKTVREEDALSVAKEIWLRCKTSWRTLWTTNELCSSLFTA